MTSPLVALSDREIYDICEAVKTGRLVGPYTALAVQRFLTGKSGEQAAAGLNVLYESGYDAPQMVLALKLLLDDRKNRPTVADAVSIVTTGPGGEFATRDTGVVVRDLFSNANSSVLIAGYAVYQGRQAFQTLANRMLEVPGLQVRLFLDVQRGQGDTTRSEDLVRRFAVNFKKAQWPKERPLPELYFDPRSLQTGPNKASLHAKCVVVDGRRVFVSSANFTEAAQLRNIEIGVLLDSVSVGRQLPEFFDTMLSERKLSRIPLA